MTAIALLDTTQYVRVSSSFPNVLLQSNRDTVRIAFTDSQPSIDNTAYHNLGERDPTMVLENVDTEIWVLAMTDRASLVITEFEAATQAVAVASTSSTVTSTDSQITSDFTIPAGFLHASIIVETGTAAINGVTYGAGESLDLPPMSSGSVIRTYPAYPITAVTGSVRLNYHV